MTASSPRPAAPECSVCAEIGGPHGVPTAPDTTGELREALLRWLAQRYGSGGSLEMRGFLEDADALVRGPLRALIAERDTAVARVQAVREFIGRYDGQEMGPPLWTTWVRRALDGAATTGGGE